MPTLIFSFCPARLSDMDVAARGDIAQVYFYCAPIHDHHGHDIPTMVPQPDGTFRVRCDIPDDAVGSFLIAPVNQETARRIDDFGREEPIDTRARWRELVAHRLPPEECARSVTVDQPGVWSAAASPLESGRVSMPNAPLRLAWPTEPTVPTVPAVPTEAQGWVEDVIAGRKVWLAGPSDAPCLLILLDATTWIRTPLPHVLAALTAGVEGVKIPPVRVIAVDTEQNRCELLGCSADFASWVAQDLLGCLPTRAPDHVAIAGQSLGGLTAANVVRLYPERIARAIGNSPSFWWPTFGGAAGGDMVGLLRESGSAERLVSAGAQFFFSAGRGEGGGRGVGMVEHARAVVSVLSDQGVPCELEITNTAHEMAAWEGALTRGVLRMWG